MKKLWKLKAPQWTVPPCPPPPPPKKKECNFESCIREGVEEEMDKIAEADARKALSVGHMTHLEEGLEKLKDVFDISIDGDGAKRRVWLNEEVELNQHLQWDMSCTQKLDCRGYTIGHSDSKYDNEKPFYFYKNYGYWKYYKSECELLKELAKHLFKDQRSLNDVRKWKEKEPITDYEI